MSTTALPHWHQASCALDLVPQPEQDAELAERFVTLAGKFMLTQGPEAGRRLEEVMLPWQRAAMKASFQCRESLWVLGKGSGKSVSVAAMAVGYTMLSHILGKNTRGLVAIVAPTIPSARIVFDHITEAILADEELRPHFKSNAQNRSITHEASGIQIQVLPVDMKAAVGRRPVLLICDELHETATPVINQFRQGRANWGRAFKVISISTMPIVAPAGEFKRQLNYARAVRDGSIDDPDFLPLLFTFPLTERPDLDPLDPDQWWRGMPSLRTSEQSGTMDATELERELKQAADADDQESFALTLSQRLGIKRNDTDAAESILHSHWKNAARNGPVSHDFCVVGIDAGGLDDPMAVAVARRPTGKTRQLSITVHQLLTQTGFDRAPPNTQEIYEAAVKNKTLHIHPTSEECDAAVYELVTQAAPDFVGGDEHGRSGFATALREATGKPFQSVPQTWVLGAALASLESRLLDNGVTHNHCPLLMWNVDNLLIEETPQGNRRLKKRDNRLSGQGYAKIDGIIAIINAVQIVDEFGSRGFDVSRLIG